jgi:hypothetical protein
MSKHFQTLRQFASTLSPSCQEVARLQSLALDRPLNRGERVGLQIHLILCRWCRRYGRQLAHLHALAQEHQGQLTETVPAELPASSRERLKAALRRGSP